MSAPDRANDPRRVPEFKTIPDKTSPTGYLSSSEYQQKYGWVSAHPFGSKNWSPAQNAPDPRYV